MWDRNLKGEAPNPQPAADLRVLILFNPKSKIRSRSPRLISSQSEIQNPQSEIE
ncbi:hypothetical protein D1AOALGA4SA_1879 [Olavius algarvensis Delta 1 endosymbiont]|nr:hypothetical protein D1AOALGA4SA_1879 [Olavius algarvensis Delta 1 endosymbiont]